MTHTLTFFLGVLTGLLLGLWAISRSIATPETASVPGDAYVEDVWERLLRSPGFNEGMAQARDEYERGEFTPYRHRVPRPQ